MAKTENKEGAQRQTIVRNTALALVAVAVLGGGLLMLERNKSEPAEPAAASETEASAPRIGVSIGHSVKSEPAASMPAAAESTPISPELAAEVQNAPDTATAALAPRGKPTAQAAAASSAAHAPVVPEGTMDPSVKPILAAPTTAATAVSASSSSRASSSRAAVAPEPAHSPAPAAAVASVATVAGKPAFVVQMGVFNSVGNAEDLLTKLKVAGIPAQLETRVQVGPFATRAEALRAQEKLRALGLGKGMLVPPKKP